MYNIKKSVCLQDASKPFSSAKPSLGPSKSSIRFCSIFVEYLHCNIAHTRIGCWYQGIHPLMSEYNDFRNCRSKKKLCLPNGINR